MPDEKKCDVLSRHCKIFIAFENQEASFSHRQKIKTVAVNQIFKGFHFFANLVSGLKLQGLLQYMLNECRDDLVSVEKEIKMVEDYISLEKVRYGNNLDFEVRIVNHSNHALVAPFLLIPFLENSFKHGSSQILKSPWIKLDLVADFHTLHFRLV